MLRRLPAQSDPALLSGFHAAEDVGIVRVTDDMVLCQSVDFFTPIVDDPHMFGAIAAANSLSDLYAAGVEALTAMSILCYPEGGDLDELAGILQGAHEKVREAGAFLVGGHSVSDEEVKFGLSVTGVARPDAFVTNGGARPGDLLYLTKSLGTGILSTAIKARRAPADAMEAGIASMARLNAEASRAMMEAGAHAATDVTGFGLLGHGWEMASASDVRIVIEAGRLPLLPGVRDLACRKKFLTRGSSTNRSYVGEGLRIDPGVPAEIAELALDPQTSGGLLVSLPPEGGASLVAALEGTATPAVPVGRVEEADGSPTIHLTAGRQ